MFYTGINGSYNYVNDTVEMVKDIDDRVSINWNASSWEQDEGDYDYDTDTVED